MQAQISKRDDKFLAIDSSKLPLAYFDEDSGETKTPSQWIAYSNGLAYTPVYTAGAWRFEKCTVSAYDPQTKKYSVTVASSGAKKRVGRLSLRFEGENRRRFDDRVAACVARKEMCKAATRYWHYVESHSSSVSAEVSPRWLENILKKAIEGDKGWKSEAILSQHAKMLGDFLKDTKRAYASAMKHAHVRYNLLARKEAERMVRLRIFRSVDDIQTKSPVQEFGLIHAEGHQIDVGSFKRASLLSDEKIVNVLQWMIKLWIETFDLAGFFDTSTNELAIDKLHMRRKSSAVDQTLCSEDQTSHMKGKA